MEVPGDGSKPGLYNSLVQKIDVEITKNLQVSSVQPITKLHRWYRSQVVSIKSMKSTTDVVRECAASGDERTWSAPTKADAAELVSHSATSRCPRALRPALKKRRSARPLCAPQARTVYTRQRATGARTLPACLPCIVMLCHQRHCRATLQCRPLWDRA